MIKKSVIYLAIIIIGLAATPHAEAFFGTKNEIDPSVVEGNNHFAIDLYAQLARNEGNFFFSPMSISTALAMTYAGARGKTAEEVAKTLHFLLPQERLHPAMGALTQHFNESREAYALNIANALWVQDGLQLEDDFLQLTQAHYQAGAQSVDFSDREATRTKINEWIVDRTQQLIQNFFAEAPKGPTVLTNAIYFKGHWKEQFQKERTQEEGTFYLAAGETIATPLMVQMNAYRYGEEEGFQILELPYEGEELSMIVILPQEPDALPKVEARLTAENFHQWYQKMQVKETIWVTLPKFTMTEEVKLKERLQEMGMPLAFDPENADFSGMTRTKSLMISEVLHKAYVDVNEEGTEAAAVTGVGMAVTSVGEPPTEFKADHPFVFIIYDRVLKTILFMGRMVDPTLSGT